MIGNALKFTNSGGSITLELLEDSSSTLNISVIDTGSGMTDEVKEKLSTPFSTFGNSNN